MELNISALVVEKSGQKFAVTDFISLCKPRVYLYMRGIEALYIGMGKNLLARASSEGKQWHRSRALSEADMVMLYPCVSIEAVRDLEALMIGKCKPKYNKQWKMYAAKLLGVTRAGG